MSKRKDFTKQRNKGEGNRVTAQVERDLTKDSIRRELDHAEPVGKRHAAGEVPEVRRPYRKN
jgi:hypothetical protein